MNAQLFMSVANAWNCTALCISFTDGWCSSQSSAAGFARRIFAARDSRRGMCLQRAASVRASCRLQDTMQSSAFAAAPSLAEALQPQPYLA